MGVYDHFLGQDARPWIVMELIAGQSLEQVLRSEGWLSADRVAFIGRQALDALSAAHGAGIVYRDVKPANVLLDGARVVLGDFSIAVLDGDPALTRAGAILGPRPTCPPSRSRDVP